LNVSSVRSGRTIINEVFPQDGPPGDLGPDAGLERRVIVSSASRLLRAVSGVTPCIGSGAPLVVRPWGWRALRTPGDLARQKILNADRSEESNEN
jgi:hypothetical protein